MNQNQKQESADFAEEYLEVLCEEDLIELLDEERKVAINAISCALQEEYTLDYRISENGEAYFYLLTSNPIRLSVKDGGYVEFGWFGDTIRNAEPICVLNDLTVLKSRIDYRKNQRVGVDPYVEYSLLCEIEAPELFANTVLLNALFFQADINNIVARLKRCNPSFGTIINWEPVTDEY